MEIMENDSGTKILSYLHSYFQSVKQTTIFGQLRRDLFFVQRAYKPTHIGTIFLNN